MQDADNLDDARFYHAVEDHVYRACDRNLAALVAAVANMKAANAGVELATIDRRSSLRIGCNAPHRRGEASAITYTGLFAVKLLAPPQNPGDICFCRLGKPISRHAGSTGVRRGKL